MDRFLLTSRAEVLFMIPSRSRLFTGVCFAALVLGACNRKADAPSAADSAAAEVPGQPSPEKLKDAELSTKIHEYIGCLNRESSWAFRARSTYLGKFDRDKGPTGKEISPWVPTVEAGQCVQAIGKAKALPPALGELEASAATYASALGKLEPLVKEAHDYYEQKNYKDDDWAKAKQMHAPLVAALDAFKQAHEAFDKKVGEINDGLSARRLARLAKDPSARLEYLITKCVEDAKNLADLADVQELAALDGAAYGSALSTYEKSYQEYQAHATAHPEEAKRVVSMSSLTSSGGRYLTAAKELMRRKRDDKDYAKESGAPDSMPGNPAQVLKEFNDVIEASNDLEFRSP
jgi:hypothetical protein